jgi:hypothetical protein
MTDLVKAWTEWADYLHSTEDSPHPPDPKSAERWLAE